MVAEIRSIQNLLIVYYYLLYSQIFKIIPVKTSADLSVFCIPSFELEAKEL